MILDRTYVDPSCTLFIIVNNQIYYTIQFYKWYMAVLLKTCTFFFNHNNEKHPFSVFLFSFWNMSIPLDLSWDIDSQAFLASCLTTFLIKHTLNVTCSYSMFYHMLERPNCPSRSGYRCSIRFNV